MIRAKPKTKKLRQTEGPIDPDKLKGYVERIERVEQLIADERSARADIYTEVKASGMKSKMVRRLVKERAKKEEDEAELAELERYRAALAMPGATYRSVAKEVGVPSSTLHRLVPKSARGTEQVDPETGEITGSETGSATRSGDGLSDALSPDSAERCGPGLSTGSGIEVAPLSHYPRRIDRSGTRNKPRSDILSTQNPACPSTPPQQGIDSTENGGETPPGEGSRHDRQPDGPGSALATLQQDQAVDLNDPASLDAFRMRDPQGFCAFMEARGEAVMPAGLRRKAASA